MKTRSRWIRGPWLVTLLVASLAVPDSTTEGAMGGRGGRTPRHAAPRRPSYAPSPKAPRMSNSSAANRTKSTRSNNVQGRAQTQNRVANAGSGVNSASRVSTSAAGSSAQTAARPSASASSVGSSSLVPNSYTYGTGKSARSYTANGYGRGSRNRSGGGSRSRSQTNNRAIVSRLRSVHSSLARIDHDYRGHRVQAMHSVSNAIRQLSHRSTSLATNNMGRANNNNNGRNPANAGGRANNAGARQGARLTQAQSDGRMSQALRTTQGIQMQMSSQRTTSSGHLQARSHVARAVREMHTALVVR